MDSNNRYKWKQRFLIVAAGQAFSLIGSSAVQFALIWWLASETGSPMTMAFSGLAAFLPQLLLGPFAGVWIDRMKRKTVVIGADLFTGAAALGFAVVFAIERPPVWSVFVVLGIRALGGVFHTPAIQALIPKLVPAEELVRANGWSQFMQSGAFMLGPVLGALMYGVLPMWIILMTDFIGAVIASAAVWIIKVDEPDKIGAEYPHFWTEFKEGAAVYRKDRALSRLFAVSVISMIFFMPLSSLYPLMTSSYFEGSALQGSIVELLYAMGMMLAAFCVGLFGNMKDKLLVSYLGLFGVGVTSFVCGILPSTVWAFWIFAGMCCLMGGFGNIFGIPCMAYMQETIAPQAQGRAFSLWGSVTSLAMPAGLLLSGPFAEKYGVASWFLITGIGVMVIVLCAMEYHIKKTKG